MARPAPTRTELALYVAIVVTQYAVAAGITTIYSMLSHLYRDFDDLGAGIAQLFGMSMVQTAAYVAGVLAAWALPRRPQSIHEMATRHASSAARMRA